jgi:hypothetical protein
MGAMQHATRARFDGWRMVLALAVTETVSFGILFYAFTVFVEPMRAELGWSTATITAGFSIGLVTSGLMAPLAGRWVDRHGPRGLMTVGSLVATAGLVAWSQVSTPLGFYALWACIGAANAMVLYEPAFALVAVWFDRRRGAALTLLTFVAGFASVIFVPLAGLLVERLGWRDTLLALAGVQLLVTTPLHALVLRRSPADVGQEVDGGTRLAAPAPLAGACPAEAGARAQRPGGVRHGRVRAAHVRVHGLDGGDRGARRPPGTAADAPRARPARGGGGGRRDRPGGAAGEARVHAARERVAARPRDGGDLRAAGARPGRAAERAGSARGVDVRRALRRGLRRDHAGAGRVGGGVVRARAYGTIAGRMTLVGTAARAAAPVGFGALVTAGATGRVRPRDRPRPVGHGGGGGRAARAPARRPAPPRGEALTGA